MVKESHGWLSCKSKASSCIGKYPNFVMLFFGLVMLLIPTFPLCTLTHFFHLCVFDDLKYIITRGSNLDECQYLNPIPSIKIK
jgi:hypothetical protein